MKFFIVTLLLFFSVHTVQAQLDKLMKDKKKKETQQQKPAEKKETAKKETAKKETVETKYKVGQAVEVLYSKRWYPGKITSIRGTSYRVDIGIESVKYNDFPEGSIRLPGSAVMEFKVGDLVDYGTKMNLYKSGTVKEIKDGKYLITAKDGTEAGWFVPEDVKKGEIIVFNLTGANFEVGQRVKVKIMNQWVDCKITNIDQASRRLEVRHGYTDEFVAFDDEKLYVETREKAKEGKQAFTKEVANPYFAVASAINWAAGDERLKDRMPSYYDSYFGYRPEERLQNLPKIKAELEGLVQAIAKFKDQPEQDPNDRWYKLSGETDKELKYSPAFYRAAAEKAGNGLALFMAKMLEGDLKSQFESLSKIGEATDLGAEGKSIWFYEGKSDLNNPGSEKFEAGTYDIVYNGGKEFQASLKNYLLPTYQAAGLSEADIAPLLQKAQAQISQVKDAFFRNLTPMRATFPYRDAGLEETCKKFIKENVPGAVILGVGITDASWDISYNDYGIPECRLKWGGVHFKEPKTGLCAYAALLLAQDYAGSGTYTAKSYVSSLRGFYFGYYVGKCQ